MESKALVKSTNNIVACRFFERTPSRILRIVKICEVVDLFLWKPFWLFRSMLSTLGSMRLRSWALYILVAMCVSVIPQSFLANLWSPFLGKERIHPVIHLSIGFWLYTALQCRSSMSSNFQVFHTSGVFRISQYRVEFFLSKRSFNHYVSMT